MSVNVMACHGMSCDVMGAINDQLGLVIKQSINEHHQITSSDYIIKQCLTPSPIIMIIGRRVVHELC